MTQENKVAEALRGLLGILSELSQIEDGKTLFEHSPSQNTRCLLAWTNLDLAVKRAKAALQVNAAEAAQSKIGNFDARDSFSVPTDTTTLQRNAGNAAQAHGRFVPGVMHCAKCHFRLVRTNLYVRSGTTGPGSNETEPCPNGCGPLWPVTWEQEARECWERLEAMAAARPSAQDAEAEAKRFHETYERLAPQFGYSTRYSTREFDPESPNSKLLIAVWAELFKDAGND